MYAKDTDAQLRLPPSAHLVAEVYEAWDASAEQPNTDRRLQPPFGLGSLGLEWPRTWLDSVRIDREQKP